MTTKSWKKLIQHKFFILEQTFIQRFNKLNLHSAAGKECAHAKNL